MTELFLLCNNQVCVWLEDLKVSDRGARLEADHP